MTRALGALLALCACVPTPDASNQADVWPGAARIRSARLAQNVAIGAHDLAAIRGVWTNDVTVTTSSGDVIVGPDAYLAGLSSVFDRYVDAGYERIPERIEPSSVNGLALEHGHWTGSWTDNGTPVRIRGTYMAQWRLEGGAWRIRAELFVALSCDGCDDPSARTP